MTCGSHMSRASAHCQTVNCCVSVLVTGVERFAASSCASVPSYSVRQTALSGCTEELGKSTQGLAPDFRTPARRKTRMLSSLTDMWQVRGCLGAEGLGTPCFAHGHAMIDLAGVVAMRCCLWESRSWCLCWDTLIATQHACEPAVQGLGCLGACTLTPLSHSVCHTQDEDGACVCTDNAAAQGAQDRAARQTPSPSLRTTQLPGQWTSALQPAHTTQPPRLRPAISGPNTCDVAIKLCASALIPAGAFR